MVKNIKKRLKKNKLLVVLINTDQIKAGTYPLIKIGWDQKKLQSSISKFITTNNSDDVVKSYKLTILVEEETILGTLQKQKIIYFERNKMKIETRIIN